MQQRSGIQLKRTYGMQHMCGLLLDLAEQTWRRKAEKMLSILQNRIFDLAVFKSTVMILRDCEDVLKRGAEKFFREGDLKDVLLKWKKTLITWRS